MKNFCEDYNRKQSRQRSTKPPNENENSLPFTMLTTEGTFSPQFVKDIVALLYD
jgi:hypothetical protein